MKRLAIAALVVTASSRLAAQAPDRTLERISLALERPRLVVSGADGDEAVRVMERQILGVPVYEALVGRPGVGPFEFVAPQLRGEFIRVALPVGKYLTQGISAVAGANRRRQEQAVRRRVEAELNTLKERTPKPH